MWNACPWAALVLRLGREAGRLVLLLVAVTRQWCPSRDWHRRPSRRPQPRPGAPSHRSSGSARDQGVVVADNERARDTWTLGGGSGAHYASDNRSFFIQKATESR